jgi:hypothetical protein
MTFHRCYGVCTSTCDRVFVDRWRFESNTDEVAAEFKFDNTSVRRQSGIWCHIWSLRMPGRTPDFSSADAARQDAVTSTHNDQRNRAAAFDVDLIFRVIRRSGSRNCSLALFNGEESCLPATCWEHQWMLRLRQDDLRVTVGWCGLICTPQESIHVGL